MKSFISRLALTLAAAFSISACAHQSTPPRSAFHSPSNRPYNPETGRFEDTTPMHPTSPGDSNR